MDKLKSLFNYCWPFIAAVLAFFSYTYFNQRKEAEARKKAVAEDNDVDKKEVKDVVANLDVVEEQTKEQIKAVEDVKLKPVVPASTAQQAVDDWNK